MATMMMPRSQASFNASDMSARCGALPAPNVSSTTPRIGGIQNALIVAPEIPGNRRRVANHKQINRNRSVVSYSAHTDMGIHLCDSVPVRLGIQQHDMYSLLCALNFLMAVCRITSFQFTVMSIPTNFILVALFRDRVTITIYLSLMAENWDYRRQLN